MGETGQNWSLAIARDILAGSNLGRSRGTLVNLDFISTNQVCLVSKTLTHFQTEKWENSDFQLGLFLVVCETAILKSTLK